MMKKFRLILQLIRPHQYVKNGFVWLPLFFGYKLKDSAALTHALWTFTAFCLAAGLVYIINDLKDIGDDRKHPVKRFRPLASGALSRYEAYAIISIFAVLTAANLIFFLQQKTIWIICGYIFLNLSYSYYLKHIAVIDVICIAVGFVLRVYAGGVATDVWISPWIIIMTFLLALFLALAKRRDDLVLSHTAQQPRRSLDGYNIEFVSSAMGVMASVIIVSYILYTVSPEVVQKHATANLYLTAFWVIAGLLRYMQITFVEKRSGSPTMILLKDYFLQAIVLMWLGSLYWLLYR